MVHRNLSLTLCLAFLLCGNVSLAAEETYVPETGSVENEKPKKGGKKRRKKVERPVNPDLPMVLILGDSISIGYTPSVAEYFKGKANIIHNPGNSQGTTNTLTKLDQWLAMQEWDVIHFNLGLHDLKRILPGTMKNSDNPEDPRQADLEQYTENLKKIVKRLKETDATLIFATTTPFPAGVSPHRDPEDAGRYNEAAVKIMKANDIEVNDLYTTILPQLKTAQKPVNVHFVPEGSRLLGEQVSMVISKALEK